MAQATVQICIMSTTSRFHNLREQKKRSPTAIGHADAVLKGAEAECKALKDEFKRRGLTETAGDNFTVTCTTEQQSLTRARARPRPAAAPARFKAGVLCGEGVHLEQAAPSSDRLSPLRGCGDLDCHPHKSRQAARRRGVGRLHS